MTSETKESFVSKTCALLDGIILIGDASVIVTQDINFNLLCDNGILLQLPQSFSLWFSCAKLVRAIVYFKPLRN